MEKYQEEFHIRYSDCDRFGRLKLKALFDYAQEIAGNHAEKLGWGMATLLERHQAWMLSRMKLRILEYPASESLVKVTTWPSGYDRLFATREYQFTTGNDNRLIAEGTSYWIIYDTQEQRIIPAQRELAQIPYSLDNVEHIFQGLGKIAIDKEAPLFESVKIHEHQIDVNVHLNNAEYAALLQDALGIGCYPKELQLNYQKGVPPESTVDIHIARQDDSFTVFGLLDGAVCFEAVGTI